MYSSVTYFEGGKKRISTVPSTWVIVDALYWPKRKRQEAYKNMDVPTEDWLEINNVKVRYRGIILVTRLYLYETCGPLLSKIKPTVCCLFVCLIEF